MIEIPIQSYINRVRIFGTAEINKYNGVKQNLSFDNFIDIGNSDGFKDYYLKKVGSDYILHALGLNGEPLRQIIRVHLIKQWTNEVTAH